MQPSIWVSFVGIAVRVLFGLSARLPPAVVLRQQAATSYVCLDA